MHNSILNDASFQVFPRSYVEGVEQWQSALNSLAIPVEQFDYGYPTTIAGLTLKTQTAYIGPLEAKNIVVLIGGTHGIEGFAGTAVQCDLFMWLSKGHLQLPDNTALLAINALNPWGYHFLHRCDNQGIDVNRNFVNFEAGPPVNVGYTALKPLLSIEDIDTRQAALNKQLQQLGARDYEVALSGGQYSDPFGPFYGGLSKSFSREVIENLIEKYQLAHRNLAVIDIHTGLGPYGYGEVICDHPLQSAGYNTANIWYGKSCTSAEAGTSSSVPKLGLLDYAWHQIMGSHSAFITLEFGTLGTQPLFNVLLEDARIMKIRTTLDTAQLTEHQQNMKEHFCPNDPIWREAVIFRARQVFKQALDGVSTP